MIRYCTYCGATTHSLVERVSNCGLLACHTGDSVVVYVPKHLRVFCERCGTIGEVVRTCPTRLDEMGVTGARRLLESI
jgi:ribosomal protein L44E